ncbi:MAG: TadE/TadG family type IV pilus assembly protein [Acidaminobacteraceae bacterium]
MHKVLNRIKNKKGQSIVEMALILPIIMLLFMGILDFGRIMNSQIQISSASRSGARLAAIGKSDSDIINMISISTNTLKPANLIVTITPNQAARSSEDIVTVLVEYDIQVLTPGVSLITGNPYRLSSDTSMIVE